MQSKISAEQIQQFQQKGYLVLRKPLDGLLMEVLERYVSFQRFNNHFLDDKETVSKWCYSDVFCESLMVQIQPMMEEVTQRALFPTNTVLRIYQTGGKLRKHVDRATCEYSITLTIGYEASELYPIWVRSEDKDIPLYLDRGDMLIYKGCEVMHWREEFKGRSWAQVFIHYVDANGENAKYKFDGRLMVGMNKGQVLVGKQVK